MIMQRRRWIAIIVAVVLVFMSVMVRFGTSVASGLFAKLIDVDDGVFEENIIRDGSFSNKIAVVNLNGVIMDLGAPGFFDEYNHSHILMQIDQAFSDDSVDAVILQVDSPGGGVHETAEIHRLIVESQEEYDKPFYVSMGGMAASGGYYVAAPADKIYAEATTLTGSIGVIMESLNYAGLAEKHGVSFNTFKSGKHKDIMSPSREMTDEERDIMQSMIDEMYDEFVDVIVDGRGMDEKKVREVGDGRIYTGKQAKEIDLIDEVGSLEDTIDGLMADHNLADATVVQYSSELSFFGMLSMSVQNLLQNKSDVDFIQSLLIESDQPRAMYIY